MPRVKLDQTLMMSQEDAPLACGERLNPKP